MSPLQSSKSSNRHPQSPKQIKIPFIENQTSSMNSQMIPIPKSHISSSSSRALAMSMPEPLQVQGACCPRRPSLDEILSNQSQPPWTLSAFMAYLSHNHCLETLEFTMDAKRYRQHFEKTCAKLPDGTLRPGSEQSIHLASLWQRLMQAYIQPNGVREVNLPSSVRDELLAQDISLLPPQPDILNVAVLKVHELMEESVLVPFLNSLWPPSHPDSNSSSAEDLSIAASFDERGQRRSRIGRRSKHKGSPLSSSPPFAMPFSHSSSGSPPVQAPIQPYSPQQRASAPSAISQFARSLSTRHPASIPHSNTQALNLSNSNQSTALAMSTSPSATPAVFPESMSRSSAEGPGMTEDSMSAPSIGGEPMTPPTTPPASDQHSPLPQSIAFGRSGNPWKRMRYSFGWGRKRDSDPNVHNFQG